MDTRRKISVVVCTCDRPFELQRLLRSLDAQTEKPQEIIVVDSSKEGVPLGSGIRRIASPKGLTLQRNVGIAASAGDVIVFMDDDSVLTPNCLEAIGRGFRDRKEVGAVTGRLLTRDGPPRSYRKRFTLARVFGLGESFGQGCFKLSGFPSLPCGDTPMPTQVLFGGLMAFRKSALQAVGGFDERLTGYSFMEDQDISARISAAGWKMYYLPKATFCHLPAIGGRSSPTTVAAMKVVNSRYLLTKNFQPSVARRIAWWWAVVGLFLVEAKVHGFGGLVGVAHGIDRVIRGDSECLWRGPIA